MKILPFVAGAPRGQAPDGSGWHGHPACPAGVVCSGLV